MGDVYPKIRLAAVQAAPVFLNREATVDKACRLIREAGANGANFVGFPENFIPGHPLWYYFYRANSKQSYDFAVELFKNSVEIPSPEVDAMCEAAADAKVFVVMGLTEKSANASGTLYNTQLFIDRRGRIVGKHQKLVPTITERLVHAGGAGDSQGVVMTEYGPVSGLCCGENSNPMAVAVLAAQYTRIHVSCWPNHFVPGFQGYPPMRDASLVAARNIAYMCKSYVLSPCGTVSPEMVKMLAVTDEDHAYLTDPIQTGGTAIIDPLANVIVGPLLGDQEAILYVDADLELPIRMRFIHDFGGHYNRGDVFRLLVNPAKPPLVASMAEPDQPFELRPIGLPAAAPALPNEPHTALGPTQRAALEAGG